jgi:hypothetical protein
MLETRIYTAYIEAVWRNGSTGSPTVAAVASQKVQCEFESLLPAGSLV